VVIIYSTSGAYLKPFRGKDCYQNLTLSTRIALSFDHQIQKELKSGLVAIELKGNK
jgi:hypothetical protein